MKKLLALTLVMILAFGVVFVYACEAKDSSAGTKKSVACSKKCLSTCDTKGISKSGKACCAVKNTKASKVNSPKVKTSKTGTYKAKAKSAKLSLTAKQMPAAKAGKGCPPNPSCAVTCTKRDKCLMSNPAKVSDVVKAKAPAKSEETVKAKNSDKTKVSTKATAVSVNKAKDLKGK